VDTIVNRSLRKFTVAYIGGIMLFHNQPFTITTHKKGKSCPCILPYLTKRCKRFNFMPVNPEEL